ncbi:MAG: MarC family protein [Ignavibacteriales bacterium]|nr:MarC family protein [Ignavibacteriales bacterium]
MENIFVNTFTIFMGFFAIMNPIANVSIFISLTNNDDKKSKKIIAFRSLLISFLIVVVFSITGKIIFEMFSITMFAFRITGGIIVFIIGYHMLQGNNSSIHHLTDEENNKCIDDQLNVAISPLAMPILAGPGTIATAMNFSANGNIIQMIITISAFGFLCVITYLLFVSSEKLTKFISVGILGMITRLMGLILAVIGVQMLIAGIKGAFNII